MLGAVHKVRHAIFVHFWSHLPAPQSVTQDRTSSFFFFAPHHNSKPELWCHLQTLSRPPTRLVGLPLPEGKGKAGLEKAEGDFSARRQRGISFGHWVWFCVPVTLQHLTSRLGSVCHSTQSRAGRCHLNVTLSITQDTMCHSTPSRRCHWNVNMTEPPLRHVISVSWQNFAYQYTDLNFDLYVTCLNFSKQIT